MTNGNLAALAAAGKPDAALDISIDSSVPAERGLGSSAAVSAAVIEAVLEAAGVHLRRVGFGGDVVPAAVPEGVGEVSGTAAHVEDHRSAHVGDERLDHVRGVAGERAVEARGIGLFVAEVVQQSRGASQGGEPGHPRAVGK